jgi:hypothetical protein
MCDEAYMGVGQRRTPNPRLEPVEDSSTWRSLVSPLAVALAFALMIAGLLIESCNGG